MTEDAKKPLGYILLQNRAVSEPELDKALASAKAGGPPLASRLTDSGAVSQIAALKALSEQAGVPGIDLNQVCVRLSDLEVMPREIALRHKLLPVLVRSDRIFVAMATPSDKKVIDELEFVTGKRVFPYVALAGPLLRTIVAAYDLKERGETHYAGPECPEPVLRKAGLLSLENETHPPGTLPREDRVVESDAPELGFGLAPGTRTLPPESLVVVDDVMRRVASADEVGDIGASDNDPDLSIAQELPLSIRGPDSDGRRTILVVDDEPDIRNLLRRVFEDRGYCVLEADRGLLALRIVKERSPDVLVLDAMLPEVHGFDIARRIKRTQRYQHIPIVMVSAVYRGRGFAEDLRAGYGVDAYIEKPFRVADVVSAVERALSVEAPAVDPERISAEAEALLISGIEAYRAGDINGSIASLRNGAKLDPLAFRIHYHLGLLLGKRGDIYDAIQALETALDINGKHFSALKNLAVLYQKAGFRNKVIETWERALGAAPDDSTRQSIKEHLLRLL